MSWKPGKGLRVGPLSTAVEGSGAQTAVGGRTQAEVAGLTDSGVSEPTPKRKDSFPFHLMSLSSGLCPEPPPPPPVLPHPAPTWGDLGHSLSWRLTCWSLGKGVPSTGITELPIAARDAGQRACRPGKGPACSDRDEREREMVGGDDSGGTRSPLPDADPAVSFAFGSSRFSLAPSCPDKRTLQLPWTQTGWRLLCHSPPKPHPHPRR